jgi:predicted anti-sigma-YlaC factor YlaD
MSHQPFENWLLSDEKLDEEQEKALQAHLDECQQCRLISHSWNQVENLMLTHPAPEPEPGFSLRWQQRLAFDSQRRQQRKMWLLTLGLFSLASIIFVGLALVSLFSTSFSYEISQLFANFAKTAARISHFWDVILSAIKTYPMILPLLIILGMGGVSATITLIVTWLGSLIRFYQPAKEGAIKQQ